MFETIAIPIWVLVVVAILAAIAAFERMLVPSVRWFFRRRMERVVTKVNNRLARPIDAFKLAQRQDMIQQVLYHPDVMSAVAEHAEAEDIPREVAFEEAKKYANEIVPSFSATAYFGIGTRVSKWLSQAFYRVRLGHFDQALFDIDRNATVVFVMNHRSNMDYVIVTFLAARSSALSYAVGEWARVWPLSFLIKAMGAYFIRRKSRGLLYRRVLSRYVQMATAEGVTQAMFPEGGLSLDGRLAPAKMGLLNYIVGGWQPGGRDVIFVPVAINYDRIMEDRILVAAGEKGERRFRARMSVVFKFALKQLWLRISGGFHKNGYAAVSFGQPLSLTEFAGTQSPNVEAVAEELMGRIAKVMPVLPVPLLASVMLEQTALRSEAEIKEIAVKRLTQYAEGHVHLPRSDADYAVEVGLRQLRKREFIEETDGKITIVPDQKHMLGYYAATIAHLPLLPVESDAATGAT